MPANPTLVAPVSSPPSHGFYVDRVETLTEFAGEFLTLARRGGFYPAVTHIAYACPPSGLVLPPVIPNHRIRISWQSGQEPQTSAPQVILKDDAISSFFTVVSDGERGITPPYVGGGMDPYRLVIWTAEGVNRPRFFEVQWRYVPRASLVPGVFPCP